MQIACPNCATSYRVVPSALGKDGRSVRCVRCLTVWFAQAPEPELVTVGPIDAPVSVVHREEVVEDQPISPPMPLSIDATPPDAPADELAAPSVGEEQTADHAPAGDMNTGDGDAISGEVEAAAPALGEGNEVEAIPITDTALPVTDAPPVAPHDDHEPPSFYVGTAPVLETAGDGEVEGFAARRLQRQRMRRRNPFASPGLPGVLLILIGLVGGLFIWRKDIVRLAPQTASFYAAIGLETNLRGLTFEAIKTVKETQDGIPVLIVEGKIVSTASRPVEVPRIRLAVRASSGHELYSWTALPSRSILAPGDSLTFVSRLASPPAESREVMVRFFNRRDVASGSR
ncbi:MAG: zinc-ribbon domain-containing protein [Rhizobiales bacterium]|nr:zinc-ribbon domain-containing protein [Hyphomicrobiales bacterium]